MYIQNSKTQKFKKYASYLYDYHYENNLDWPVVSVQWGPLLSESSEIIRQKLYFSCRTDGQYNETENTWKKQPSFLVVGQVDCPKPEKIFNQDLRDIYRQDKFKKHQNLKVKQIIIHPGDVNAMKKCPLNQKLIATKNDSNNVFIWDLQKQKHKSNPNFKEGCHPNTADIILTGHSSNQPSFALDWAKSCYRIASGAKDLKVLVWNIEDYNIKMNSHLLSQNKRELNFIGNNDNVKLNYFTQLIGHTEAIEDISFHPNDMDQLVSVGDDKKIIFWDLRISNQKVSEINSVHTDDINAVDWNIKNDNYICTGSEDSTATIIDIRVLKPVNIIQMQNKNIPILSAKFSPFNENLIAIGSDNLYIYDSRRIDSTKTNCYPLFNHFGHKGIVNDFDWNSETDWTLISTCQDKNEVGNGGGQLQMFRPNHLLTLPKEDAVEKLKQHLNNQQQQKQ